MGFELQTNATLSGVLRQSSLTLFLGREAAMFKPHRDA